MPIYEYRCPDGHWTDHFSHRSERDSGPACACGASTERGIQGKSGPPKTVVTASGVVMHHGGHGGTWDAEARRYYWLRDHVCSECDYRENEYTVWVDEPTLPPPCPQCGAACVFKGFGSISRFSEHYTGGPKYDPGLNAVIGSKRERREEMKRQGVREADDMHFAIDAIERRQDDERRRDDAAYEDMVEREYRHSKSPAMRKAFRQIEAERNTP